MDYERKLMKTGGSVALIIPPDVCKYLEVEEESDIILRVEEGKKGKYISVWKKVL